MVCCFERSQRTTEPCVDRLFSRVGASGVLATTDRNIFETLLARQSQLCYNAFQSIGGYMLMRFDHRPADKVTKLATNVADWLATGSRRENVESGINTRCNLHASQFDDESSNSRQGEHVPFLKAYRHGNRLQDQFSRRLES